MHASSMILPIETLPPRRWSDAGGSERVMKEITAKREGGARTCWVRRHFQSEWELLKEICERGIKSSGRKTYV